jgi:antitoxin component of RelBE/YafQ-DinJ toxin-antitoxin module
MPKDTPIPIRLDAEMNRRASEIAQELGITRAALIRMLLESFVEEYDKNGGRIMMPPKWKGLGEVR